MTQKRPEAYRVRERDMRQLMRELNHHHPYAPLGEVRDAARTLIGFAEPIHSNGKEERMTIVQDRSGVNWLVKTNVDDHTMCYVGEHTKCQVANCPCYCHPRRSIPNDGHASDCSLHNEPACPNGCPSGTHLVAREPCDCGAVIVVPLVLAEQLAHDLNESPGCEDWPAAREFIVAVRGQL